MKIPKPEHLPSGAWRVRLRLDGESISITRPTKTEAINEAKLIKAQFANDIKPYSTGRNMTLDQAIDVYIEDHRNVLSPSTIRGYGIIRRNRFQSVMNKRLKDIRDWQVVVNNEAKMPKCSPKTLQNAWRFVGSVMRYQGVTPPKVMLPQVNSATREWLDYEEIETFLEAVEGTPYELCALLALSSLRRSEIFGLSWGDVDLKHEVIKLHQTMTPDEKNRFVQREATKNKTSRRTVPILIPRLLELLKAERGVGLIMSGHPDTYNRHIGMICDDAGLPHVGLHGLRHSFASLAYHVGMDQRTCMEIGGWSNPATMQLIYQHIAAKDKEYHKNAMKSFFEEAQNKRKNAHDSAHKNQKMQ